MLQNYGTMKLLFTMENYGAVEKNYYTTDKTMVLYREPWNFDLRRKIFALFSDFLLFNVDFIWPLICIHLFKSL